jgi:Flp pilus assembly protein TadB
MLGQKKKKRSGKEKKEGGKKPISKKSVSYSEEKDEKRINHMIYLRESKNDGEMLSIMDAKTEWEGESIFLEDPKKKKKKKKAKIHKHVGRFILFYFILFYFIFFLNVSLCLVIVST